MMWRHLLVCACIAAAPVGDAAAQRVNAAVEGHVTDETGMALADVSVSARNRQTGVQRVTSTGRDGRFVIAGLPVEGEYDIRVERAGFAPAVREAVTLVADDTVVIDVILRVMTAETIVVGAPSLFVQRSDVQQTIDEALVRSLPLFDRRFLQLASLAAGFTGHPDYPNPQGQQYWTNNVLVDGASHFSKWRSAARAFYSGYGLESIRDVQVFTNRFTAEFGQALASVTSATTKAGTNQWHGGALLFVRDAALDAAPAFSAGSAPARGQQFAFSLGGPLAVDRTHLFASYEGRRTRDRNIVVSPAALNAQVPDDQDEHLLFARIDHQQESGQHITARYNGQRFRWHDEFGGLSLPGTGTRYINDVQTALVTHTMPISMRTLHDLRLQFARYVDIRRDLQPSVFVSRAGYAQEGGLLGPAGFGANPEDTWEAVDTVSHWAGPHALQIGGGLTHVRAHATSAPYGHGAYFFAGAPEIYPEPFLFVQGLASGARSTTADPRALAASAFIQDDWRLRPRVTLNLGVRYDVEDVFNVAGYDVRADRNNVQPRVGVAWDPGGAGRTVIRGGAGVYTQQMLLYPIDRVQLEGQGGVAIVSVPAGSAVMPRFPATLDASAGLLLPPRDIVRADPAFGNPYSVQSTVGVQRLMFGGALGADYVYLHGLDLVSFVDANAPASIQKPAQRTVAQADATRPLVPAPTTYRKIVTLGNAGESWYHALQVTMRRSAGSWQGVGSYTLARAEDMADGELPEDSRNIAAEKGRAATDVTHNLSTGLTWVLPEKSRATRGWSLSALGVYRSGRPYTVSWGDDRNGTTQNDARPGARNTRRGGAFRTLDLAATRRFGGRVTTDARLEAFNVLNATNYDQYVGTLISPLFGRPVSAFPRRRLQLAVVVRF